MRAVFMGTPEFAADILAGLLERLPSNWELVAVYTRPDAVRGRGKALVPSPVKRVAEAAGLPVLTPKTLKAEEAQAQLSALQPDVVLVAAYGMLLPQAVLDIPRLGCYNAHASLLPRWRGAAPVERAMLAGDESVGVCVMKMEAGLDTGDFAYAAGVPVEERSSAQLLSMLAPLAVDGFCHLLEALPQGGVPWQVQDETLVTYAHKLEKGELDLSPEASAVENVRKVRVSTDAHPAKCTVDGVRAAVTDAAVSDAAGVAAGRADYSGKKLLFGTADGVIEVRALKPEGKKEMAAQAFCAGRPQLREHGADWGME
ncbi:MAG: methionyl-tRNA formyltransferase [Eggerthellaceae bacterium]|nr:methionyl-tRNA formyltransferase [Eggerthellaceae bacterium]